VSGLRFQHELLIPDRNGDIYFSVYEIENWLRRICLAACMIKHGIDWPRKIDSGVAKRLRGRLNRNRQLFYLGAETDDNLIWMTMHRELHSLLFHSDLWPIVKDLTQFTRDRLSGKLQELNDIRNLLAHNRAFSQQTETVFRGLEAAINRGIASFKSKLLYPQYEILDDTDPDGLNVAFQDELVGNDWSKFQAFLGRSDFFYKFVCLPVSREHDPAYISGARLLRQYADHLQLIIAFTVNKTADEYCVLVPRGVPLADAKALSTLFVSDPDVWTAKRFVEQDAQYICHPKIWFYEDRRPEPE
jgi:hypothetical protein